MMNRLIFSLSITYLLLGCAISDAAIESLPDRLTSREVAALSAETHRFHNYAESLLIIPGSDSTDRLYRDPRDAEIYRAVCYVYIQENNVYVRRFAVFTPDRETLPYARRAGQFCALLWSAANSRFGTLCQNLRADTVNLWLTRRGEGGGEHFRNNLYLYSLLGERTGLEWARTLAHEYGHYLLPGASGYTEPESWGNGLLGERLFLRWIRDDLQSKRLEAAQVPFVSVADLNDYCEKQVYPLIEQIRDAGPNRALLAGRQKSSMDAFTGLMLFADQTYGSLILYEMLIYLTVDLARGARGDHFLDALERTLDQSEQFTTTLPDTGATYLYLPKGSFWVTYQGDISQPLIVLKEASATRTQQGWVVKLGTSRWRVVGFRNVRERIQLHWKRR
jgi:hypothetical protein